VIAKNIESIQWVIKSFWTRFVTCLLSWWHFGFLFENCKVLLL